ncbi:MAG: helix-turn-helix transcriptional regulator [Lachnospiraceae bacterium]|nr:helix-turn-helix transcriptional regulator [Lachnospiraceae bacterium]
MPKPKTQTGEKNLISKRLIELRHQHNMSQRLLAYQLQLKGYDMDKNVITRIETNKRYVTDLELKALTEIFDISYDYLIDGKEANGTGSVTHK